MTKTQLKKYFKPSRHEDKYIVAQLNDKIMPIDRVEIYGDPLDEFLKMKYYGRVTGGGTLLSESGENEYCDIEIKVIDETFNQQAVSEIIAKLEELGAPKGSQLIIESSGQKIPFGKLEGMAVYLDGITLSDEVYKNSDAEAVADKIKHLTGLSSDIFRHWQGNTETALYFYGPSFVNMRLAITELLATDPECENARIVQIA
ncbi:hypothetical protein A0256_08115 [Mucilaginibacter sp. PAMC 26640]|nr:hypothetical protein A0256_08115 [Mucilaginibacter sp. PAMC 26640]